MPLPHSINLITLNEPRSPISEAYRSLRTQLEFSSLDHPLRSLLATTPAEADDKAITLANLAVIMGEGGRRIILVEGDLRRPALHEVLGLENKVGLSDLLRGNDDLSALPCQETGIEGLRLLASGPLPPNPAVLLGSARMAQVLEALNSQADMVLWDAPPVLAVTDAALLAARVDGVLLMVRAYGAEREHVQRAQALLAKIKARLIGAVLTHASLDRSVSGYYKY